jgi:hypothetical protein
MGYSRATMKADLQALGIDDPGDHCWLAYEKALHSAGDLVIGRGNDLTRADLYRKVADITGDTMLVSGASGNLLKADTWWSLAVNDSWLLGGIHRGAKFRLASPRLPENLWNATEGYLIVTARELLGLLQFGYALEQIGPWQVLVCKNQSAAASSNLIEYDKLIKRSGSVAQATEFLRQATPGRVTPGATPTPLVGPPTLAR